jgi:hypothetical protein
MSTFIYGIKPVDDKYKKMKNIHDACREAGVCIPKEVTDFFEDGEPDCNGIKVELFIAEATESVREFRTDEGEGWYIDINKLPSDIKMIKILQTY